MPDRDDERRLAVALDAHWDALLAGAVPPPDDLDPGLAATAQRVHALDTAATPHPAFSSTLWEDLMAATTLSSAADQPLMHLPVRPLDVSRRSLPPRRFQPLARIAAAMLLVSLLAGAVLATLYPLHMRERGGLPILAPAGTPTVAPVPTGDVLLDLTLSDIPPYVTEQGIGQTTYPPGGSSREVVNKTAEVMYIASGPMTVHAEEATRPVRVVPPAKAFAAGMGSTLLDAGETIALPTGWALVAMPGAVIALSNDGDDNTVMLDLLWATASGSTEAGGAHWTKGWGGRALDLVLPVSVVLRQIALPAGETLPGPNAESVSQAAVTVDPGREADLLPLSGGALRNGSDRPLDLYAVTITSNAGNAASPAATDNLQFLWESVGGAERLSRPYGLGIDPSGNLWVSDASNDRFQILAPDGTYLETWGTPGTGNGEFEFYSRNSSFGAPYGDIAFDADGTIYVADTGNFRVQKFAPDRTFLLAWGSEGEGDGQFLAPSSIAVGPDGTVYVSDEEQSVIQAFDADGRFLQSIAVPVPQGRQSVPAGIDVDDEGDIWLADYGSSRILRFSPDGSLRAAWGNLGPDEGELISPNDVAVDGAGRVFVADDGNNRLQVFTKDGQFIATVGGSGTESLRRFRDAVGVAVTAEGVVYVTDDPKIQAYRLD